VAKVGSEPLVPRSGCLLHIIMRSLQQIGMVRGSRVNEAWWLLAVDGLIQLAIQLVNGLCARGGDAEDDSDHCGLVAGLTIGLRVSS
jgi:hypothetical protein